MQIPRDPNAPPVEEVSTLNEQAHRGIPTAAARLEYELKDQESTNGSVNWMRRGGPRSYTPSYELGYGHEGSGRAYQVTAYYRRNLESVTDVTQYLDNGVSLTTRTNLPRNAAAGLDLRVQIGTAAIEIGKTDV